MADYLVRVLVIEDDYASWEVFGRGIKGVAGNHAEIVRATSLQEAAVLWRQQEYDAPFDVVVLDLGLPPYMGARTLEVWHKLDPITPVVVLTGQDTDSVAEQLRGRVAGYLLKGTDAKTVWRTICNAACQTGYSHVDDEAVVRRAEVAQKALTEEAKRSIESTRPMASAQAAVSASQLEMQMRTLNLVSQMGNKQKELAAEIDEVRRDQKKQAEIFYGLHMDHAKEAGKGDLEKARLGLQSGWIGVAMKFAAILLALIAIIAALLGIKI